MENEESEMVLEEEVDCRECEDGQAVGKYFGGSEVQRKSGEEDGRSVKKLTDPRLPTKKEVEDHELTHLPYRNWCAVCVMAKGKDLDHRACVKEERSLNEYAFDYCFPGDEFGYKITVLAGRERNSGMLMATTVPTKGSSGKFAVEKAMDYLEECGDGSSGVVITKSDQEPAIKYFMKDLREARGEKDAKTIPEESQVKSSQSNGVIERGVQAVEGQMRALLLALGRRLKIKVHAEEKVVMFMAEYAAYLVNRLETGKDGKTAYERIKGKRATVLGIEFGEKLLYKVKAGSKMEKLNPRWEYGIFVGVKRKSGEVWIAKENGIVAARSVRRIPEEERWTMTTLCSR